MGAFIPAARAKFPERLDYVYALFPAPEGARARSSPAPCRAASSRCAPSRRTLMSGPKLVLLDEPSMGLAPVIVAQVFDLVRRIRSEGYTVLIVEQNVRQVLKVVDRAYLLEVGRIKASGPAAELAASDDIRKAYMGHLAWWIAASEQRVTWTASSTSSSLEALINGLLLAGLLALLALGLNLVFGVIDVVWICYAELVMVGMYGINYAYKGGAPFLLAAVIGIVLVAHRRRPAALPGHPARARQRRRSTSCSSPAACCSSCRPPPPWRSASSSRTSASASARSMSPT